MEKVLIAVAGPDKAGVVYSVAEAVFELKCDFVDMSQTTVDDQFSSIMIVNKPKEVSNEELQKAVLDVFKGRGFNMSVVVMNWLPGSDSKTAGEPFVITLDGHNSKGLLFAVTRIFYEGRINIDSFRSIVQPPADTDSSKSEKLLLVFEVTIPFEVDRKALYRTLSDIAKERKLSVSMQHRQIFEAVHRVATA